MKFLTIRQPWASLIAIGAKTIETRPFGTAYRGPLAIHAGKARPPVIDFGEWSVPPVADLLCRWGPDLGTFPTERHPMRLGAVVAVCDLVDVVPIVEMPVYVHPRHENRRESDVPYYSLPATYVCGRGGNEGDDPALWLIENGSRYVNQRPFPIDDQLPFGDFTPGRYAWLLDNVRPIDPIPMKGAQGLRDVPDDIAAQIEAAS